MTINFSSFHHFTYNFTNKIVSAVKTQGSDIEVMGSAPGELSLFDKLILTLTLRQLIEMNVGFRDGLIDYLALSFSGYLISGR